MSVIDLPITQKLKEEKGHLLAELHRSVQNLQRFIVKHSVDALDQLDIQFIDDDKNTLMVLYETVRRK